MQYIKYIFLLFSNVLFSQHYSAGIISPVSEIPYTPPGYNLTSWTADTTDYEALPPACSLAVSTIWTPPASENNTYNHHPHILSIGEKIYLVFSTHRRDEEAPGQYIRYSYSANNGETWATVDTLIPPLDAVDNATAYNGSTRRRVMVPSRLIELSGKIYCTVDVFDKVNTSETRLDVGMLAVEIDTATNTPLTPFWVLDKFGQPGKGDSIPGQADYNYNAELSSTIIEKIDNPEWSPVWADGIPDTSRFGTNVFVGELRLVEPQAYKTERGLWMKQWRAVSAVGKKYVEFSADGETWGGIVITPIPDQTGGSGARTTMASSRRSWYISGNGSDNNRHTLWIAKSSDGLNYTQSWEVDTSSATPTYTGTFKSAGCQYPHMIVIGEYIFIAYSVGKESIRVAKLLKP